MKKYQLTLEKVFKSTFIIAATMSLGSCSLTMYEPNMQNAPLLAHKGDVAVNLTLQNYQAAYAVTDNVGVMANFYHAGSSTAGSAPGFMPDGTWGTVNFTDVTKRFMGEVGAGYFIPFAERGENVGVFETYGGLGFGNVDNNRTGYAAANGANDFFKANALKIFIQPAIGYKYRDGWKSIEASFSTRLSIMDYSGVTSNFSDSSLTAQGLNFVGKGMFAFFEPAITVKSGFKNFKIVQQFQIPIQIIGNPVSHSQLAYHLGISIDIPTGSGGKRRR